MTLFARSLTPYEAEKAERDKVAKLKPHLALVPHTPVPTVKAQREHFVWKSVAEMFDE